MNEQLIQRIVPEIRDALLGLRFREAFQLGEQRFALAFDGDGFRLLFIGIETIEPRIYLIERRLRDLKKLKTNPSKFTVDLTKSLEGRELIGIEKEEAERVIEFQFRSLAGSISLMVQLTGKSANMFVLDSNRRIVTAAKKPNEDEQSIGMVYKFPSLSDSQIDDNDELRRSELPSGTLSQILDKHYLCQEAETDYERLAAAARKKCRNELSKLRRLMKNLETDLEHHGDAKLWKRFGDLLLASQSTAVRKDSFILVKDLFQENAPLIEIEADPNESVAEAAQRYFRKYIKARNGAAEIASRLETVQKKIEATERLREDIEAAVRSTDIAFFESIVGKSNETKRPSKKVQVKWASKGIRSFTSSDGFEILVGKKAVDNDVLSFKVANSRDTWMHAADYPGSHVVIRNADRKDIPQKTLIEGAQLAAFYSQGNKQPKAAVNYTLKKFVNKPKGSSPGLVRLASFKTILVAPIFPNVSPK